MRGALSSFVAIKKLFTVGAIGKYFSVPTLRRQESIKKKVRGMKGLARVPGVIGGQLQLVAEAWVKDWKKKKN